MSAVFVWRDRHGVVHHLTSGESLIAERAALEAELAALAPAFEHGSAAERDAARAKALPLLDRHDQLMADGDRWNAWAEQLIRPFAAETIVHLNETIARLAPVADLVEVHDEHQALCVAIGEKEADTRAFDSPPTDPQMRVIEQLVETAGVDRPVVETRRAAYDWIQSQPLTARALTGAAGWFDWTDKHGVVQPISDALPIERELAEARNVMTMLASHLTPETDMAIIVMALEGVVATFERAAILRYDLERLDVEADARDVTECASFAARLKELGS